MVKISKLNLSCPICIYFIIKQISKYLQDYMNRTIQKNNDFFLALKCDDYRE